MRVSPSYRTWLPRKLTHGAQSTSPFSAARHWNGPLLLID
jgi:hypothetical protein